MGQEEEKGVTGGEDGTLGLGRMPGAQVVLMEEGGRQGVGRESSSQAPTPPQMGCSGQGSPQLSDTLVGSSLCYPPPHAFEKKIIPKGNLPFCSSPRGQPGSWGAWAMDESGKDSGATTQPNVSASSGPPTPHHRVCGAISEPGMFSFS